ncbi:MAG: DegT/DnrJ/EryC1/StrS family aminotransferase [Planctomycetota bacterium]|nr:DegT/DnrJ/EryC1/StrS family aminotransferase [Planctomycetota bacterium]
MKRATSHTGKPAILGGSPTAHGIKREAWPPHGVPERKALLEVLESGKWWRGGTRREMAQSVTGRFEREFAKWHGARHGLCVTNGTAALELALRAAGVEAGDEVVVPALSFVATATAVPLIGARAVFADAVAETYQTDPAAIEAAIGPRTRAILVVHYGGYCADLDRITKLARRHKLPLIEDCAHAQGSQWRGRGAGSWGDAGCFSFQMSKALTAGEGGIVLSNSDVLAEKLYSYHHLGRLESQGFYDFHRVAWNMRMTEWQGAILGEQLKRVKKLTLVKQRNAEWLAKQLDLVGGLLPLKRDPRITRRGFYYFLMRYDARDFANLPKARFVEALQAEGLPVGQAYGRPIQKNPVFAEMRDARGRKLYAKTRTPVAERICAQTQIALGHTALLNRPLLQALVDGVARLKAHAGELAERFKEKPDTRAAG